MKIGEIYTVFLMREGEKIKKVKLIFAGGVTLVVCS
jgi:hypothetical protein